MIHCNPVDPDESNGNIVGTITMQPNHSLSWKALGYFLMFMLSVSFTIAFAFTAMGYWVVLPFTALEMAVLSYCLWLCLKRSSIQEVLSLTPETIKLEVGVKRPQQTYQWQRFFTKIRVQPALHPWYRKKVSLVHKGEEMEIGGFLSADEQKELLDFLRTLIRRADAAQVNYPESASPIAD
ncbi:MAG: DUF2244 domain-containing protein [Gammaproteobacteria bacterium TMED92]|nr:MAG: DUF2244 domain-containing protein [Gammaproteobacteria bacterium TMED92]